MEITWIRFLHVVDFSNSLGLTGPKCNVFFEKLKQTMGKLPGMKVEIVFPPRLIALLNKELYNYFKANQALCYAATRYCVIMPDMNVYPCNFLTTDKWKLFNFNAVTFYENWKNSAILRQIRKNIFPDCCKYCAL